MKKLLVLLFLLILATGCTTTPEEKDYMSPYVQVTSPWEDDYCSSLIVVRGTVSDKAAQVTVFVDFEGQGLEQISVASESDWEIRKNVSTLGDLNISVWAIDPSGNESEHYTFKVVVLNGVPNPEITSIPGSLITNQHNLTLSGTVTWFQVDTNRVVSNVTLHVINSSTNIYNAIGTEIWSGDVTLEDGTNSVRAYAMTDIGVEIPSAVHTIIIDSTGPSITNTSIQDASEQGGPAFTVRGTISDAYGLAVQPVKVRINGGAWQTANYNAGLWSYTFNNGQGTHNVEYIGLDAHGNTSTNSTGDFTITVDDVDPSVALSTYQDTAENGSAQFTVRGTASDNFTLLSNAVYVKLDSGSWQNAKYTNGNWSMTFSGTGSHTVSYFAVDRWGNHSATNVNGPFSINAKVYQWNIFVFLNADNNLEPFGLADFNEMENVLGLTNEDVNVIVLFDRSSGYSTLDGDWTGTRLYKVSYDNNLSEIHSGRLSGMGLTATGGNEEELDMGLGTTLNNFLTWGLANFQANNNCVILWDHGDGWRNSPYTTFSGNLSQDNLYRNIDSVTLSKDIKDTSWMQQGTSLEPSPYISWPDLDAPYKAISLDEGTGHIIKNADVRTALSGKNIDVLGFDGCLMGMFEVAYELRGSADYLIVSPDLEPGDGWNYTIWLSNFCASGFTAPELYSAVIDAYGTTYASQMRVGLAAYDMSKVDSLFTVWQSYVSDMNAYLWNTNHINRSAAINNTIMNDTESYVYPTVGGQFYPDVWDLADKMVMPSSTNLKSALEDMVVDEWHSALSNIYIDNPNSHGVGVYFGVFADASLNLGLETDYVTGNTIQFTANCAWDTWLKDLYSFPPYKWMGHNMTDARSIGYHQTYTYQIYVKATSVVQANMNPAAGCDDDLYLLNTAGTVLAASENTGSTSEVVSKTVAPGWYFVVVSRYSGFSGNYFMGTFGTQLK